MSFDPLFKKVKANKGWSTGRSFLDLLVGIFLLFCALPYCVINEYIPTKGLLRVQLNEDPIYYWLGIALMLFMGLRALYESPRTYKRALEAIKEETNNKGR